MPKFGTHLANASRRVAGHAARDEGGMGIFGMFMFGTMAAIGGIALDVSHLYSAKVQLQVAADLVAHAALYNRDTMGADDAKTAALAAVLTGMPEESYGTVLTADDIVFGTYDYETGAFTEDEDSLEAVWVRTERVDAAGNAAQSFLWRIIGIDTFDVITDSIYVTYQPMCFREGFVAEGVVDIQSNNSYFNGFCIHSNEYVSINQNNYFEPGTVVSMPDISEIDLPSSGFEMNEGLEQALRSGAYRLRIVNKLPDIIEGLKTYGNDYMPDYINSSTVNTLTGRRFSASSFTEGRIHIVNCTGGKASIDAGTILRNMVIVTPCEVHFGNGVQLENVIIASSSNGVRSMYSPQGLVLGRDDDCAADGGAQLLSLGDMNFAADLHMYGGQMIAVGDIEFAANAEGIEGASMISGGVISGTSNMNMGFCDSGMEDNFEANYYRLAR